ncbi:MAG: hypothetical protein M3322_00720, partial [Actinomycetota bacterium]|nr:hypothetical protein [Actinomycetota bacterium]
HGADVRGEDTLGQILAGGIRAKLAAQARRPREGLALANASVAMASETDALVSHADALVALAEVLRLAGRRDEARGAAQEAIQLYEEKGNVVSAARATAFVREATQTV